MFEGPLTGEEEKAVDDNDFVTHGQLATTLANYSSVTDLLTTTGVAQQALQTAETINVVEQNLLGQLNNKASTSQLTAYALNSQLTNFGTQADVSAAITLSQTALTVAQTTQNSINTSGIES